MDCRKLLLSLTLPLVAALASAQTVTVDGKSVDFDASPQMVNGTLMVPVKNLLSAMDVPMRYIPDRQVIEALRAGNKVELWIGSSRARVNDNYVDLDEPSYVSKGRTFVPLKFVAEQLKYSISYEHGTYRLTSMQR
jgi:hypothetical protein